MTYQAKGVRWTGYLEWILTMAVKYRSYSFFESCFVAPPELAGFQASGSKAEM